MNENQNPNRIKITTMQMKGERTMDYSELQRQISNRLDDIAEEKDNIGSLSDDVSDYAEEAEDLMSKIENLSSDISYSKDEIDNHIEAIYGLLEEEIESRDDAIAKLQQDNRILVQRLLQARSAIDAALSLLDPNHETQGEAPQTIRAVFNGPLSKDERAMLVGFMGLDGDDMDKIDAHVGMACDLTLTRESEEAGKKTSWYKAKFDDGYELPGELTESHFESPYLD